MKSVKRCH